MSDTINVPIEPTPAMLDVAVSHALMVSLSGDYNWSAYMRDVWKRMLAAAPKPSDDVARDAWIPVGERLPKYGQEVIVNTDFEGVCAGVLDSYGEWFAPCSEYKLMRITHWMPLPAAPIAAIDAAMAGGGV